MSTGQPETEPCPTLAQESTKVSVALQKSTKVSIVLQDAISQGGENMFMTYMQPIFLCHIWLAF